VLAAPAEERCCSSKAVGGVRYTYLRDAPVAAAYSCLNDCVYQREGRPGAQYCFARGDLQVECGNSTELPQGSLTAEQRVLVDYGFEELRQAVEGECTMEAGQLLAFSSQVGEDVFQFTIEISNTGGLSCSAALPSVCTVAVAEDQQGRRVEWNRVACDNTTIESMVVNLFQALANATHLFPEMGNITGLLETVGNGGDILQTFGNITHLLQTVRNISDTLEVKKHASNLFQAAEEATAVFQGFVNASNVFLQENTNNDLAQLMLNVSATLQLEPILGNFTNIFQQSIQIASNLLQSEGNFTETFFENSSEVDSIAESVSNIIESVFGTIGQLFPSFSE